MTATAVPTAAPTDRDRAYLSIFVTALEGGINYWSRCKTYHWTTATGDQNPLDHEDVLGFYAEVYDVESPGEEPHDPTFVVGRGKLQDETVHRYRIDRAVIAKGVGRFIDKWASAEGDSYYRRAARDLRGGHWNDLDVDALIADEIVQLGLFGKGIYG
jgi:hypothetical protein